MKALIIGATGATGSDLLRVLLQSPAYSKVTVFVRNKSGLTHPKLLEIHTDFDNIAGVSDQIQGDVLFSCLGTTRKAAGSEARQWHIDYEIPAEFARIARKNEVREIVLVSAFGATPGSRVFYSRMKGQLEETIKSLSFQTIFIFKPGLLLRKDTNRPTERISATLLKGLNAIGLFRKFRPMPTQTLAEKLAEAAQRNSPGVHVVELDHIFSF